MAKCRTKGMLAHIAFEFDFSVVAYRLLRVVDIYQAFDFAFSVWGDTSIGAKRSFVTVVAIIFATMLPI